MASDAFFRPSFLPRSGDLRKLVENLGAVKLERLLELFQETPILGSIVTVSL